MRLTKLVITLLYLGILKSQIVDKPKSVSDYNETPEYGICTVCIEEPKMDEKIRFYFTNKAIHIASNDYATIKIMNTNLQIIIEEKICPKTTTSIDLSNVSSGIYYLLIFIQNKVAILKILYLT